MIDQPAQGILSLGYGTQGIERGVWSYSSGLRPTCVETYDLDLQGRDPDEICELQPL